MKLVKNAVETILGVIAFGCFIVAMFMFSLNDLTPFGFQVCFICLMLCLLSIFIIVVIENGR